MKRAVLAGFVVLAFCVALGLAPARRALAANGFPGFATTVMTLPANSAVACPPLPMVGRSSFSIYNGDSAAIYVGASSTVNASTGYPILAGSSQSYDVTYQLQPTAGQLYCFSTAGTASNVIRILEVH